MAVSLSTSALSCLPYPAVLAAGLAIRQTERHALADDATRASEQLALYGNTLHTLIERYRALPAVLALDPELRLALSGPISPETQDALNHRLEQVSNAAHSSTLELLDRSRHYAPNVATKSGLMLGLGETDTEVRQVLADLRGAQVGIVTLGQYLRPTRDHAPVARYVPPADFEGWAGEARALGFASVYSGVFVRSSFNAEEVFHGAAGAPLPAGGPVSP